MKKKSLLIPSLTLVLFTGMLHAAILPVPAVYPTVQGGIDASMNGDTVLVYPGTYFEHLSMDGKNIVLCSKYLTTGDPSFISTTILDGFNSGRVLDISSSEDTNCRITGFTIRHGNSSSDINGIYHGGGIRVFDASPRISHCIIENNQAPEYGGGLSIYGSNAAATATGCIIRNNTAESSGGGLFMGDCSPGAEVVNCVITGNSITCDCSFGGGGGGVNLYHTGKLTNCLVTFNSAPNAPAGGGGVYCDWGDYYGSQGIFVTGCTIAHNTALDYGGVSYVITGGEFRNCIVWGNTDGNNTVSNYDGNTFYHCCTQPLPWGTGNLSADPLFLNATANNFRLTSGSPCIGAGYDAYNFQTSDLDGNPRIYNIIDMGAYEFGSDNDTTVQVGDGTDVSDYLPLYSPNIYNYSQQIYLDSELAAGGALPGYISKIRFYYEGGSSDPSTWNDWTVYLGNTAQYEFAGTADWVPFSSLTQVYSGVVTVPSGGNWMEISLSTPFFYTGGHLVVAVDENAAGYDYTATWGSFYAGSPRGLHCTDDVTNPDPASPPDANWWPEYTLPRVQFAFSTSIGIVEGYVMRNPGCSNAVAGATISSGTHSTTSDSTGFYRLVIPAGTYFDLTATDGQVSQTLAPVFVTGNDTTTTDFCLPLYFPPPVMLQASITGPVYDNAHLTWLEPGSVADHWLAWGDQTLAGSLGYGNMTISFSVASRWPVQDIAPYDGMYLKKIRIYPTEAACQYTLKVWKGANASTLLHSQAIPNLNINAWNEINLSSPVLIDGTDELWFGYEANQTDGFPAGLASGPAVAGKGDMFNQGGTWISMKQSWNFNYNWLLQGFVSESPAPMQPGSILSHSAGGPVLPPATGNTDNPGALVGYNIYRDNVLVADSAGNLFYDDPALPRGGYDYTVTALYELGESAPAGPVHVNIYTCFPPTGLTASNVTLSTTSADLSWIPSVLSPVTNWALEWGPAGFNRGSGTLVTVSGVPAYSLTNLSPGTEYDYYLSTACSPTDTSAWVKKSFRTHYFDCAGTAAPETEACGDSSNNGCLLQTASFDTIQCGDTLCGSAWLSRQSRDSDWFLFTLTDTNDVIFRGRAEFSGSMGIKSLPCPSAGFITETYLSPGWNNQVTAQLLPGSYVAYLAPTFYGNVTCDSLDRFEISLTCSDCLTPTNLATVNAAPGSVLLSWSSGTGLWDIEWEPVGFGQGNGTLITGVSQKPYTLTGLSPGISYDFYVRSDCGGGAQSAWAGPFTFFVPCNAAPLPYFENFSSQYPGTVPLCWYNSGSGSVLNWMLDGSSLAGGASPELTFASNFSFYNDTAFLVSPVINTAGRLELNLSFAEYRQSYSAGTSTGIMTTSNGGATWQWVYEYTPAGTIGPVTQFLTVSNSDVGSSAFQFAFVVRGVSWDIGTWRIDDISIDGTLYTGILEGYVTDCSGNTPLAGVTVSAGTDTTVTDISGYYQFPALPIGTYTVGFRKAGFDPGDTTGVLIEDGFTTYLDECLVPSGPPENAALQNLTVGSGQPACYDALQTITVAGGGTTFTVSNGGAVELIAGQKINFLPGVRVFAGGYLLGVIAPAGPFCSPGEALITATPGSVDGRLPDTGSNFNIRLYPNPTTRSVRLDLTGISSGLTAQTEIINMQGVHLYSANLPAGWVHEITLDGAPDGLYLIRVRAGEYVFSNKVLKVK